MQRTISAVAGFHNVSSGTVGAAQHAAQANCPFCASTKGFVRRVSVTGDQKTLTFVCADCRCRWDAAPVTISTDSGPYSLPPKLALAKRHDEAQ